MPTIETYEGQVDLQDHLDAFNEPRWTCFRSQHLLCKCFAITLLEKAKNWILQVEPETVVSWGATVSNVYVLVLGSP